jgi:hypothetical protein
MVRYLATEDADLNHHSIQADDPGGNQHLHPRLMREEENDKLMPSFGGAHMYRYAPQLNSEEILIQMGCYDDRTTYSANILISYGKIIS